MSKISNLHSEIAECFKMYKGIHSFSRFERKMNKIGFQIDCTRKHMALQYKGCPEKIFVGLTPSDSRAYLNNSHIVMRVLKKHKLA